MDKLVLFLILMNPLCCVMRNEEAMSICKNSKTKTKPQRNIAFWNHFTHIILTNYYNNVYIVS